MTTNTDKPRAPVTAATAPADPKTTAAIATHVSNAPEPKQSPVLALAKQLAFSDAGSFAVTLKGTIMPGNATDAQVAMLCSVALAHGLNPLKREVYAFPDKGGGIRPIISIDGWYTIMNSHPAFRGITREFQGTIDQTNKKRSTLSCICRIYRSDRDHPIEVEEFLDECYRDTDPWRNNTRRMLQHRAAIQCIRVAFGLAGVMDQDDYERMVEFETLRSSQLPASTSQRPRTAEAALERLQHGSPLAGVTSTTPNDARQASPEQLASLSAQLADTSEPEREQPRDEPPQDAPEAPSEQFRFDDFPAEAIDNSQRD